MKNLTLENIAAVCGGTYHGDESLKNREVTAITTDSRTVTDGCLFIPVKGERVDGHRFIPDVMKAGALATLSEQELPDADFPYIRINASLQAVKDIAEFYLTQLSVPVVGITGSVGKTSTKEMIASVLSQHYYTLKTQGNFNNELGLPLTVFRLRQEHEIAVLEMGINHFGEMSRLAKIAKPDTCVITNIGDCHLESLIDRDGVFRAKTEVFNFIKEKGKVILNGDDDKLSAVSQVNGQAPIFFGLGSHNSYYADNLESCGLRGTKCRIHTPSDSFEVQIPIPGRHMVYNALAGTAVGTLYGLTTAEIKQGIESLESLSGRFHLIEKGGLTIIDDCYNANPMSMKASLGLLQNGLGRKIAILGDMGELGENEAELHRSVGEYAGTLNIDKVLCAGPLCEHLAEGIRSVNPDMSVEHFSTPEALLCAVPHLVQENDTLLVKASHFMHFEKIVKSLENR